MKTFSQFITEGHEDDSGVQWKKDKSPSPAHHNGKPGQTFHAWKDGSHLGQISTYSAYQDKKKPGSRIVTSRKDVVRWKAEPLNPHTSEDRSGRALTDAKTKLSKNFGTYMTMGHRSANDAKRAFVQMHKEAGHL